MADSDHVILLPDEAGVSGNMDVPTVPIDSSAWTRFAKLVPQSSHVRHWLSSRHQSLRPWLTFFSNFSKPPSPSQWSRRLVHNVHHFQSNYACLCVLLLFYCLVTSPLLLLAIGAALSACYVLSVRQAERPLVLGGRTIPLAQQYTGVALLSVPLLLLVGVSSALFWVLGASVFVVMLHASLHKPTDTASDQDQIELFQVSTQSV